MFKRMCAKLKYSKLPIFRANEREKGHEKLNNTNNRNITQHTKYLC